MNFFGALGLENRPIGWYYYLEGGYRPDISIPNDWRQPSPGELRRLRPVRRGYGMDPTLTPSQRSLRARCAAYVMHSRHDARATTAAARAAFAERWNTQVDPEGRLAPADRYRRARAAKSAYFARLAYLSARARSGAR